MTKSQSAWVVSSGGRLFGQPGAPKATNFLVVWSNTHNQGLGKEEESIRL